MEPFDGAQDRLVGTLRQAQGRLLRQGPSTDSGHRSGRARGSVCAPTPAVVLALGRLGAEVAADVEGIFLRGDGRRAAVTCFLALAEDGKGRMENGEWRLEIGKGGMEDGRGNTEERVHSSLSKDMTFVPVGNAPPAGADCIQTRRAACERFVAGAPHLRRVLEGALREMHTHERLIEAGLGDVLSPPVDLIVVADLTEPGAAGALIPLALLLQDLLAHEPYGMGHLLLSTAVFPGTDELAEAQIYATLQDLDALTDSSRAAVGQPLTGALGLEGAVPLPFHIYLFDHRKEGTREVKDRAELRVILGNFLLALLSGGLAQRLGDGLPVPEMLERRAFYSSAAATALIFDPEPLIEACAGRLGAEFVVTEMGPDAAPDPRQAGELAAEMDEQLGSLRSWLERLCADTPCEIRAAGPSIPRRSSGQAPLRTSDELHLGLHFTGFRFEQIRKEGWAEAIASYDALFGRVKLPRYRETMEENASALARELLAQQGETIENLPQSGRLYPGGLQTVRRALRQLDERLEDRIETLSTGAQAVPLREEADLQELEQAAWNFPDLPAFVARLVLLCTVEAYTLITLGRGPSTGLRTGLASRWTMSRWLGWIAALMVCAATVGAGLLWLRRKDQRLIALRDRCVRNSERKYAALLEEAAREQLIGLCGELRKKIAEALDQVGHLEKTLEEVGEQLAGGWPASLGTDSIFRVSAVDDAFAEWAHRRWRESPEEMRDPLMEEHRFLDGWREATTGVLAGRLLAYGRQVFAPVRELTVEDALRQRGDGYTEELLLGLAREAVPLLRPNFDRLGGSSHVHVSQYVLVGDPGTSVLAPALEGALAEWETVTTGDPYMAACCRVRHLIPLVALRELIHRSRRAYERLGVEERRGVRVLEIGD